MDLSGLASVFGAMVPVVAILAGIGIGGFAMMLDFKRKERLLELHHKERMAAIERGMDVPPLPSEFFDDRRGGRGLRGSSLSSGLTLLFLGVAASVALYYNYGAGKAMFGLVIAALGVARLLFHYLYETRQPPPATQRRPAASETGP
jgi:hypothetical protein